MSGAQQVGPWASPGVMTVPGTVRLGGAAAAPMLCILSLARTDQQQMSFMIRSQKGRLQPGMVVFLQICGGLGSQPSFSESHQTGEAVIKKDWTVAQIFSFYSWTTRVECFEPEVSSPQQSKEGSGIGLGYCQLFIITVKHLWREKSYFGSRFWSCAVQDQVSPYFGI